MSSSINAHIKYQNQRRLLFWRELAARDNIVLHCLIACYEHSITASLDQTLASQRVITLFEVVIIKQIFMKLQELEQRFVVNERVLCLPVHLSAAPVLTLQKS